MSDEDQVLSIFNRLQLEYNSVMETIHEGRAIMQELIHKIVAK